MQIIRMAWIAETVVKDKSLTGHGNDHSGDDEEGWRDEAEVFHFSFGGKLVVGGDLKKRGVLFLEVNQSIWVVINLSLNIIEP